MTTCVATTVPYLCSASIMAPILPTEILEEILYLSLPSHPSPTSLLLTNSTFNELGSKFLHTHLRFTSSRQLVSFLSYYDGANLSPIPHFPRTMEFYLTNDISTGLFFDIQRLFVTYRHQHSRMNDQNAAITGVGAKTLAGVAGIGKLDCGHDRVAPQWRMVLDTLWFRFNSHIKDPALHIIENALELVNPRRFIWTGPDDTPYHFSIAIVPTAVPHLFQALSKFTNLRELTLTHIALQSLGLEPVSFPDIPSLESLYIGQATFVDPWTVADAVLRAGMSPDSKLRTVRLVDAYKESIWGPRLRRSHLEEAAAHVQRSIARSHRRLSSAISFPLAPDESDHSSVDEANVNSAKEIIRRLVVCQGKTERRYGGDRVQTLAETVQGAAELL